MPELVHNAPLSLRPLDHRDAPSIAEACRAAPDITHWVMRLESLDERGAHAWIEERQQKEQAGAQITRAVADATSNELLGVVWLGRFDDEARRAELAYWTAAHARNKGIATAAVRLMTKLGFDELDLVRVQILAPVENLASRRVAERAGFTREGVLRSYRRIAGQHTDLVMHSLLNSDSPNQVPLR